MLDIVFETTDKCRQIRRNRATGRELVDRVLMYLKNYKSLSKHRVNADSVTVS